MLRNLGLYDVNLIVSDCKDDANEGRTSNLFECYAECS